MSKEWEQMTQTWTREEWERELGRSVHTEEAPARKPRLNLPPVSSSTLVFLFAVGMVLYFAAVFVFVIPAHADPPALAAQPTYPTVSFAPTLTPAPPPMPAPTVPAGCVAGKFGLVVCDLRLEVR